MNARTRFWLVMVPMLLLIIEFIPKISILGIFGLSLDYKILGYIPIELVVAGYLAYIFYRIKKTRIVP